MLAEEDELEIPTAGESQGDHNREIVRMALEDPTRTTQLIRNWIREKK
jgi:flagellar biosynthesis/type III secretory pathway M-ring protein FliF/YscJ